MLKKMSVQRDSSRHLHLTYLWHTPLSKLKSGKEGRKEGANKRINEGMKKGKEEGKKERRKKRKKKGKKSSYKELISCRVVDRPEWGIGIVTN